uniref:Ig-like domain-containing protein n=1 Tax=Poecilia latipinna TaxID=48699 RepID=A0A3B3V8Z6_9TELE
MSTKISKKVNCSNLCCFLSHTFFLTEHYSCPDKPVITPSRLVVKFGDPASATCVACQQACLPLDDSVISMEASLGTPDINGTKVTWTVDRMTEWELTPKCYYSTLVHQCCTSLSVTVYKPPETVSFSLNPSEPLTEGSKVTLQCDVLNVAPVANLTVTFYRGQTPLDEVKSNDITEKPVSETFSLSYNTRKEDDGVQFWCEAKLELGAEGPQPPLVVNYRNSLYLESGGHTQAGMDYSYFLLTICTSMVFLNHLCSFFLFVCRKPPTARSRWYSSCCSSAFDRCCHCSCRCSLHLLLQTKENDREPTIEHSPLGHNASQRENLKLEDAQVQ